MPDALPVVERITNEQVKILAMPTSLPPGYATWCDWAWDGYRKALEGMVGPSSGVTGYGIGSRWVRYSNVAEQSQVIGWWNKAIAQLCGIAPPLPSSLTGDDTAFRGVPRDV